MATQIKIKNLPEGYQSIITNGKHSIIGDEPLSSRGTDLGLSPTELVLAGLAMCKVTTVRYIARKNGWEIGNIEAELQQKVDREPEGMKTTVTIDLQIEGNITDDQRAELLRKAGSCYVHRMLKGEWNIDYINSSEPELINI